MRGASGHIKKECRFTLTDNMFPEFPELMEAFQTITGILQYPLDTEFGIHGFSHPQDTMDTEAPSKKIREH